MRDVCVFFGTDVMRKAKVVVKAHETKKMMEVGEYIEGKRDLAVRSRCVRCFKIEGKRLRRRIFIAKVLARQMYPHRSHHQLLLAYEFS